MSYLVDTHCHMHDRDVYRFALSRQKKQTEADFSPEKILDRMRENNVRQAICVGTTHEDSMAARAFAGRYDNVYWAYGTHPEEVRTFHSEAAFASPVFTGTQRYGVDASQRAFGQACAMPQNKMTSLPPLTSGEKKISSLVAIGEVGLDYHSEGYDREGQIRLFEEMIQLALDNDLPMIFHVRDAFPDFFAVLANFHDIRGVVHSFSDTAENMERALGEGYYIGVNGLATFAKLPIPPLSRMLLETDAPFLAPVPFRGRVNDSSHILDIAKWVSEQKNVDLDEVAEVTTQNARELFGLPGQD